MILAMRYTGLLMLALLGWSAAAPAADSMRCGSRLVAVEARAAEVLLACGEPDYRDTWNFQQPRTGNWVSDVEEWYYNFGSNQLLRVLKFRNGKLVDIDADGYGYNASAARACRPEDIVEGLSKFRLMISCGEPLTRKAESGYRPLREREYRGGGWSSSRDNYAYQEQIYREEWVYNFGSRYLLRIVTLENGRVAQVENGVRGSDMR